VSQPLPALNEIKYGFMPRSATLTIPSADTPTPFKYDLLDENGTSIQSGTSDGQSRILTIPVPSDERAVHLNIYAKNKLRLSNDFVLKPKDHPQAAWTFKDDTVPTGPGGTVGPLTVGPLGGTGGPLGGTAGGPGGLPGGGPGKLPGTNGGPGPVIVVPTGGDKGRQQTGGDKTQAGLPQASVEIWCNSLGIFPSAAGLVAGSKDPAALKLSRLSVVPDEGKNFKVVITPNKDCYVQVYEIYNGSDPHPVFGIDLKTHMPMSPGSPGAVARPILLPANKEFDLDLQADRPTARVIVIAYHTDQEPTADLVEILGQKASEPVLKDWTIGQAVYNVK